MKNLWSPVNPSRAGPGLPSVGGTIAVERGGNARHVGDVLGERQLAVHVQAGQRLVGVVLRRQPVGGGAEVREVLRRPPVEEAPPRVELAALVVEAVADLVADHRADRAVVLGRVGVRVEERRVQDRRGESSARSAAAGSRRSPSGASSTTRSCRPACRASPGSLRYSNSSARSALPSASPLTTSSPE